MRWSALIHFAGSTAQKNNNHQRDYPPGSTSSSVWRHLDSNDMISMSKIDKMVGTDKVVVKEHFITLSKRDWFTSFSPGLFNKDGSVPRPPRVVPYRTDWELARVYLLQKLRFGGMLQAKANHSLGSLPPRPYHHRKDMDRQRFAFEVGYEEEIKVRSRGNAQLRSNISVAANQVPAVP